MSAAIELFGAVYTTLGGTRYHAEAGCYALANGRDFHAARAGWDEGVAQYALQRRSTLSAQQFGYTACLVCVPVADALPPLPFVTGKTFGHKPVTGYLPDYLGEWTVCARCEVRRAQTWFDRKTDDVRVWRFERPVLWPCTSAVVLGLVVTDAGRWNARYPVGTPVVAYPDVRPDHAAYNPATSLTTATRTPAWRLGHGASVVSVDGYAGGIALTHVDPIGGAS